MDNPLVDLNHALASLSTQVQSSLVQILKDGRGVGAGAIWRSDGIIVTNAHVVLRRNGESEQNLSVKLQDGRTFSAKLIKADPNRDIAALQIDAVDLLVFETGDSRHLLPGDMVLATGFPFGIPNGVTTGVVIGTGAALPELGGSNREWVAASLHLRPGHSGGPMVDSRGRLVGINTLMNGPEVGVAVPVHVVADFMSSLSDKTTNTNFPIVV